MHLVNYVLFLFPAYLCDFSRKCQDKKTSFTLREFVWLVWSCFYYSGAVALFLQLQQVESIYWIFMFVEGAKSWLIFYWSTLKFFIDNLTKYEVLTQHEVGKKTQKTKTKNNKKQPAWRDETLHYQLIFQILIYHVTEYMLFETLITSGLWFQRLITYGLLYKILIQRTYQRKHVIGH